MGNEKITLAKAARWCGGTVAPQYAEHSFAGANFDSRRLKSGELFTAIVGERNGHMYAAGAVEKGAAAVLASEALDVGIPAIYVDDTVAALQAIAKGYREELNCKTVGITGSVGKTTTKEMIAAVLETTFRTTKTAENFNNGLGLPVTILGIERDCEAAVLEMGMNHFGEISTLTRIAQPDLAVITNVGTMHIENLGSREGILQAKLEILEGLKEDGTAIFNGDDDMLASVVAAHNAICFGFGEGNDVRAKDVTMTQEGSRFTAIAFGQEILLELPVTGQHNILNALSAVVVGLCCGVSPLAIQEGLRNFRNTGMRQRIYEHEGITIIEDCYNAGPESMGAALQVLADMKTQGKRIAALGGMLELGDFAPAKHAQVGKLVAEKADLLLAYGANSEHYVRGAVEAGMENAACYENHEDLADTLGKVLQPGDVLLVKGSRGMRMERVLDLLKNKG